MRVVVAAHRQIKDAALTILNDPTTDTSTNNG
jgi:hypothetical protein